MTLLLPISPVSGTCFYKLVRKQEVTSAILSPPERLPMEGSETQGLNSFTTKIYFS